MSPTLSPEASVPEPPASPSRPALSRGLIVLALFALLSFVGYEGSILIREFMVLRGDLANTRASAVVGYPGIHPQLSFAERPRNWYHQEGDHLMIWGGWRKGVGHLWFRVGV